MFAEPLSNLSLHGRYLSRDRLEHSIGTERIDVSTGVGEWNTFRHLFEG